jgi:hypothetical protein
VPSSAGLLELCYAAVAVPAALFFPEKPCICDFNCQFVLLLCRKAWGICGGRCMGDARACLAATTHSARSALLETGALRRQKTGAVSTTVILL